MFSKRNIRERIIKDYKDGPLVGVDCKAPRHVFDFIDKKAKENNETRAALVLRAVMNEYEKGEGSFEENYETLEGQEPNPDDVIKIITQLKKEDGLSLDHLIACREIIGVPSKSAFLLAYGVLIDGGNIRTETTKNKYRRIYYDTPSPLKGRYS